MEIISKAARLKILFSLFIIFCLIGFALFFGNSYCFATKQSDVLQEELNQMNQQYDKLKNDVSEYESIISNRNNNCEIAASQFNEAKIQYDEISTVVEENREFLENVATNACASGFVRSLLNEIVGNNSIVSSMFYLDFLDGFSKEDEQKASEILDSYNESKDSYENLLNKVETVKQDYSKAVNDKNALLASMEQLQNDIILKQTELDDAKKLEEKYGKAASNYISGSGFFAHPCPNSTMTSPFKEKRIRISDSGEESFYYHKGIDFAAPIGSPIYAADDGVVVSATYDEDYNGGRGMWVEIEHKDGLVTQYMHCSHVFVPIGSEVKKGDNIAQVGSTGDSTGPHVHFQVELNNVPVDGMIYINGNHSYSDAEIDASDL